MGHNYMGHNYMGHNYMAVGDQTKKLAAGGPNSGSATMGRTLMERRETFFFAGRFRRSDAGGDGRKE